MTRDRRAASPWSFDPARLAAHETAAWVAYYRRDWRGVLASAVGLVHEGFGLGRLATVRGAWLVLRANRAWAPYPANDPDAARRLMSSFYVSVIRAHGLALDADEAAALEVAWWREHRILQRERTEDDEGALVEALTRLYAYVYSRPPETVREAARHRALAMRVSDAWVADGCHPGDPRLGVELAELETSYRSLLAAVGHTDFSPRGSTNRGLPDGSSGPVRTPIKAGSVGLRGPVDGSASRHQRSVLRNGTVQ